MTRRPLIPLLAAFVAGVLAVKAFCGSDQPQAVVLTALALPPLMGTALAFRLKKIGFYAVLALFLLSGALLALHNRSVERPLQVAAARRTQVTVEGRVIEPPRCRGHITRTAVMVDRVLPEHVVHAPGEKIYVSVYRHAPALNPGMKIRFPARLRAFRNFNNPGSYNYQSAMRIKGYSCSASVSDGRSVVIMGSGAGTPPVPSLERIKNPLKK
jgi:competence protein ComEC